MTVEIRQQSMSQVSMSPCDGAIGSDQLAQAQQNIVHVMRRSQSVDAVEEVREASVMFSKPQRLRVTICKWLMSAAAISIVVTSQSRCRFIGARKPRGAFRLFQVACVSDGEWL